jgi:hypothetical protein
MQGYVSHPSGKTYVEKFRDNGTEVLGSNGRMGKKFNNEKMYHFSLYQKLLG